MTEDHQSETGTSQSRDNEVTAQRVGVRRFSDAYKVRIVEEANRCTQPGEVAALLRREGLFSSSLSRFRRLYAAGLLTSGGAKHKSDSVEEGYRRQIAALGRENRRLRRSLQQAETVMEVQKKLSELLYVDRNGTDGSD